MSLLTEKLNNGSTGDMVAVFYFLLMLIAYIVLCICMGHANWILKVLFQNTYSEVTGEVPRMLSRTMLAYTSDASQIEQASELMAQRILEDLPAAIEFGCIETIVLKFRRHRFFGKVAAIAGGFILQAIIAISWSEPVTFDLFTDFMTSTWLKPVIWILCLGVVVYAVYQFIVRGSDDVGYVVNRCANVPMTLVVVAAIEAIKAIAIVTLFELVYLLIGWISVSGILLRIITFLAPIGFILLYHALDSITGRGAKMFMKFVLKDEGYEKTFVGELFCFVIAMLMLVSCFIVYFKA